MSDPQDENLLLMRVLLNGEVRFVILDTGAQRTWIARRAIPQGVECSKLERTISPGTFDPKGTKHVVDSYVDLQVEITGSTERVASVDPFTVLPEARFEALLGMDWIRRHGVTINARDGLYHSETFGNLPIIGSTKQSELNTLTDLLTMVSEVRPLSDDNETEWGQAPEFEDLDEDVPVTEEELLLVPEQFRTFADVFSKKRAAALPPFRPGIDLNIELEGELPAALISPRAYQLSKRHMEALTEYLKENKGKRFTRGSKSRVASPGFFVAKKDSKELRFVVDYKRLNQITKKDKYALPRIEDIFDTARGHKLFSKIDLRGAYNLMRIQEGDEWKTAFITPLGTFEYTVMPFGLSNAPPAFQRWMNSIFQDMMPRSAMVYLDDIIIYSDTHEEHTNLIFEVLKRLRENRLYASPKKCMFYQTRLPYLGYILTDHGLEMDPQKVETIVNWPIPNTVKKIQRFLGFANYYKRFIKEFSVRAGHLSYYLQKPIMKALQITSEHSPFELSEEAKENFRKLLNAFSQEPVLVWFDPDRETILETDASNFAIGAILSQVVEGQLHPIAYHSRSFKPAELNYDVHDKELLSIVEALRAWRHWLLGSDLLKVYTGHKNLEYFTTTKVLTPRQVRWSLFMAQYRFDIEYRSGQANGRADALSRRDDHLSTLQNHPLFAPQNLALERGPRSKARPNLRVVGSIVPPAVNRNPDPEKGERVTSVVRESPTNLLATFAVTEDNLTSRIKTAIQNLTVAERDALKDRHDLQQSKDGTLWYAQRLFVPDIEDLRTRALEAHHDSPWYGHPGSRKMSSILRRHYAWPNDAKDVKSYVRACPKCIANKPVRTKAQGLLKPLQLASMPFQSVTMDRITHLPESKGFTSILVMVDRFSKFGIFLPVLENFNASDLAETFIAEVVMRFGSPKEVISDRGPEFASELWRRVCSKLDIKVNLSTAYHPQTDGQTERLNQTLEIYLRHYVNYYQDNWSQLLPSASFCYNTTPHSATGKTPCEVLYNYTPEVASVYVNDLGPVQSTMSAEDNREAVTNALRDAQETAKAYYDRKRRDAPKWETGDMVYLSGKNLTSRRPTKKLDKLWYGPYRIVKPVSTHAYQLELPPGMRVHNVFHVSLLRPSPEEYHPARTRVQPDPEIVDGELEYRVEAILATKQVDNQTFFEVKWLGYDDRDQNTWEPLDNVENTEAYDIWMRRQTKLQLPRHKPANSTTIKKNDWKGKATPVSISSRSQEARYHPRK